MTKITFGYAWEKQEEKRVEPLERLRELYDAWQDELMRQKYSHLIDRLEREGLVTTGSTPKGYNFFYGLGGVK